MTIKNTDKLSGRKQPEILAEVLREATNLNITAIVADADKGTFTAEITATVDGGERVYAIADAAGKVKVYADVDSVCVAVLGIVGKAVFTAGNMIVSVRGASSLVKPKTPPRDVIAAATNQLEKYQAKLPDMSATVSRLTTEIKLAESWQSGSDEERARYAEMVAQRDAQAAYVDWMAAEVKRIDAIINPESEPQ